MRGGRIFGALAALSAAAVAAPARAQTLQPPPPMQPVPPWGAQAPAWGATPNGAPPAVLAAEQADSGRGFEVVWVNAEAGGGFVNLGRDIDLGKYSGGTGLVGIGAGVRFVVWTLGARVRVLPSAAFTLYEINGEVGFHLPLGSWDPYLAIHGGYVTSGLNSQASAPYGYPAPSGADFGLSLGDDYYVTPLFSIGVDATMDVLVVGRDAAPAPPPATTVPSFDGFDGQHGSVGFALVGSLHAGLHFDL